MYENSMMTASAPVRLSSSWPYR